MRDYSQSSMKISDLCCVIIVPRVIQVKGPGVFGHGYPCPKTPGPVPKNTRTRSQKYQDLGFCATGSRLQKSEVEIFAVSYRIFIGSRSLTLDSETGRQTDEAMKPNDKHHCECHHTLHPELPSTLNKQESTMPTRIVLEDAPRSPQFAPHTLRRPRGEQTEHGAPPRRRALAASSSLALAGDGNDSPPTSNSRAGEFGQVPESKRGAYIGFRSSVLRELAVRSSDETTVASAPPVEEERLTSDDIRASPRFVGYVFSMIAASVMLVSAVQFYRQDTLVQEELPEVDNDKFFVTTGGALVYRWKLWGAVYAGSVGVGLSLFILVAHFDTICLPRLWMHVFRDGSLIERNLIFFLLAFWAATLHVCTSSLSIGEHVGNVFFTTWIAFASIALNYGVWRESAGLPSVAEHVSGMSRETTYNWIWIGIFSAVFAGASTDLYRNREDVELRYQGEVLELDEDNWMLVLAIVWTEVTVCILAVIFNESIIDTWHIPFTVRQGRYACGWRQLEGLIMLAGVGAKFWVIVEYSGVAGVVNGLSNAYFGLWGTFFNSVFGLGTWLRENKRFEYIRRDDADSARANE